MTSLTCVALGPTGYRDGLRLQEALVAARSRAREAGGDAGTDWLLFPDHPPVLTVGRSPSEGNLRVPAAALAARGIEVHEVARGGDITWHGPGQLVGYPICDLERQGRDLHRFLRGLEEALLEALAAWQVAGSVVPGRTGVWVDGQKLASIGIAVRRWVSYHGFALNVAPNLADFDLIHPCGLHGIRMTSLERLMGPNAPTLAAARRVVAEALCRRLGASGTVWESPETAWKAAGIEQPPANEPMAGLRSAAA